MSKIKNIIKIDTRGQKCPLPVLKLEKTLDNCTKNSIVIILADDPIAIIDIPLFCKKNSLDCESENRGKILKFTITKN